MNTRLRILALTTIGLMVSASFVLLEIPGERRLRYAVQNSGHGLAFALLTIGSLLTLGIRNRSQPRRLIALVSLFLFILGVSIEFAQHLAGRGASISDVGMNVLGIVAGVSVAMGMRSFAALDSHHRGRHCAAYLSMGGLVLLWCFRLPLGIAITDAFAPELPLLAAFEQPLALAKFGHGAAPAALTLIKQDPRWPSNHTNVLEAEFSVGQWPGFRLIEPPADWRKYQTLAMGIVNTSNRTVRLNVRVDQLAIGEDIFWSSSASLMPGFNQIQFKLADMRPDIALLDRPDHEPFLNVSQVLFFLSRDQREGVTLLFDDIRLLTN